MSTAAAPNGLHFYSIKEAEKLILPYGGPVKAGFPSPAQDFMEEDIDLVQYLGMDKPWIRAVGVVGDYLTSSHAPDGSYLICNPLVKPISQDLAIVQLNGEYLVRIIVKAASGWVLYTDNAHINPTVVGEGDEFSVYGVVVQVIIPLRHKTRSMPGRLEFQEELDLVSLLNMHKPSVYCVRTDGDSMENDHLIDKSFLIVDRSLKPQVFDKVVAVLNHNFTVKTLVTSQTGWVLYAANNHYSPIPISKEDDFQIWGVVAHVIIDRQEMRKRNA